MFKTDNKKIGQHLGELIKNSKYKNDRQFGIAYLTLRDGKHNPDDIQNIQNRICQIKKGKKGVQIEDLPIFSELLGVSIEDILSAGTALAPSSSRKTNYSIAFSKDSEEWDAYIQRDDKLILNPDEYNKTVIDYALEAGNYPFLKYLVDNGYIWFVGEDENEYYIGFGAGTSIRRRELGFHDILEYRLKEQDDLRFKMITLAIRNSDFEMLTTLHAREIPLFHIINPVQHWTLRDKKLPESANVNQMIEHIANSDNTALSYFFEEFETSKNTKDYSYYFVFPYAGQVLDSMIRKGRNSECKRFIERAIDHNKKVQEKLQQLVSSSLACCREFANSDPNSRYYDDAFFKRQAWREFHFYPNAGFVSYCMPLYAKKSSGFITNVICVTAKSKDPEVQLLIDELMKTYNYFNKMSKQKET